MYEGEEGTSSCKFVSDFQGTKTDGAFYLTALLNEQSSEFLLMIYTEHFARNCCWCGEHLPRWLALALADWVAHDSSGQAGNSCYGRSLPFGS